jgi:hypothetical protein
VPLRKTSSVAPDSSFTRVDSQQAITLAAAQKYNVSPQTLWGIYGTESAFGTDPATSSAGAQGPMQFEPATWAQYGGGRSVQAFDAAMPAAAKYLHDLGADTNPTSAATIAAVNAYNGNGGGSNPNTAYFQSVISKATQFAYGGANAVTSGSVSAAQSASGSGGGSSLGSPLDVLEDLVTGDVGGLAATLGLGLAIGVKDMAVGVWDMVAVPLWHRNQNATWWYYTNVLFPEKGSSYKAFQTWPVNAGFWAFGYALLFTDPSAPKGQKLTIADPRRSRVARHVRRIQAAPAKRSLVKPGDVKKHTPKKPKEVRSTVSVSHIGTLATDRARAVRVTGSVNSNQTGSVDSGDRSGRTQSTASSEQVSEVGRIIAERAARARREARSRPQPDTEHSGRQRPRESGRVPTVPRASQRTAGRDKT